VMEKPRQPAGNSNRIGEQAVAGDPSIGIDCDCGVPKHALKHKAATRVPHDSRNSPAWSRNAPHFTQRDLWLRNEEKNKLRRHSGKAPVIVFQSAGIAYFERRPVAGAARPGVRYEGRGEIDTGHGPRWPKVSAPVPQPTSSNSPDSGSS